MSHQDRPSTEESTFEGSSGGSTGDLCIAVSTGGPFATIPLPEYCELTIGRSSTSDVRIDDPSVSRRHARLRRGFGLQIMDVGSSNGVMVSGTRVEPHAWTELGVGEMLSIGSALVVVRPQLRETRPRRMWSHGYYEGRLEEECARCDRSGGSFAVLRVSIPSDAPVSAVEDTFAHWLRAADVLARYAPSEYEVLFVDTTAGQAAAATARLVEDLTERAGVDRARLRTGLARYPEDARSAEELLTRACDAVADRARAPTGSVPAPARAFLDELDKIAASHVSVLLLGETGVGKEVCAERIHRMSTRADKRMLKLNCAALSEPLLESELFGHERGAFTGAERSKPGLLETAHGGTVFFDEVGELPPSIQVKLLRVLEDRKVQRVGALEPRAIDVRFIAATNRDLDAEVATGRFRQDLLFRLNTYTLHVPPLRQRTDEIEPLAHHFAKVAAELAGHSTPAITPEALVLLLRYPWPGNIRELRNVIDRAVVLSRGAPIAPEHLPIDKMNATLLPASPRALAPASAARRPAEFEAMPTGRFQLVERDELAPRPSRPTLQLRDAVEDVERQRIVHALDACAGNQSEAARMLGVSRGTLVKRLDKYDIPRPRKGRD